MTLSPKEYRDQLRAITRSLRQEGLSQADIARELEVPRRTIARWLKLSPTEDTRAILANQPLSGQNGLATQIPVRYLVLQQNVENFQPPDRVAFPLIIADPPWYVSDPGHKRERRVRPNRPFTKDFGPWDAFSSERAYLSRCQQWLDNLYQVAAPDAWLFFWCSYRYISEILTQATRSGWCAYTFFAWHKTNPLPMFGNNNFLQSVEMALVLAKGNPRFRFGKKGGHQPHNCFESPQVAGAERVKNHDGSAANLAQKPLALNALWVLWASKPGDWVLDAFAGTGTATIAALQLGRHACAIDSDASIVHQIEARIVRECQGSVLYGPELPTMSN